MKTIRNGGQRPANARPKERDRRGSSTAAALRGKPVSAAEVRAPWQEYERRLAAKSARRLRDHAPNFLVIAPPKTATTWLYEVLSTDRRFFLPEKECRYFSHFWREYPLSSYYAQFQNPFGALWRGEASPSYFILTSSVIATIRDEIPYAKLIVLLRDPGERLWSHARHSFMYKEGWFRSSTAWRIDEVSEAEWCHALLHPVIRAYDENVGRARMGPVNNRNVPARSAHMEPLLDRAPAECHVAPRCYVEFRVQLFRSVRREGSDRTDASSSYAGVRHEHHRA